MSNFDPNNFPFAVMATADLLDEAEGKSIIVYGPPKVGKTWDLDDPKLRVGLIDLDGSSSVLEGAPNITILRRKKGTKLPNGEIAKIDKEPFRDVREVWQVYDFIERGVLKFDLVVIDSWSRYAEMYKEYVTTVYAPNRKREIQGHFGAQSDWGNWQDMMIADVKQWHALTKRGTDSINVMHIFHSETGEDNFTRVMLQGKYAWQQIMSVVDGIFYKYKVKNKNQQTGQEETYYCLATDMLNFGAVNVNAEVRLSKHKKKIDPILHPIVWSDILTKMGAKIGG